MSQSATWDALQVARDARLEGRMDVYEQCLPEAEVAWVRRTSQLVGEVEMSPDELVQWHPQWDTPTVSGDVYAERERLLRHAAEQMGIAALALRPDAKHPRPVLSLGPPLVV